MDHCNEERASQQLCYEMADCAPANPPSVAFLPFEGSVYSTHQAQGSTEVVPVLSLDPTNEGSSISPASTRCMADFPQGGAYFSHAFDTGASIELLERPNMRTMSILPAPWNPEYPLAALLETPIPFDPPISANSFDGVNGQEFQVKMPYTGDIDVGFDFENTEAGLVPALDLLERVPNAIDSSCGSNGNVVGFVNRSLPMMDIHPCDVWAKPPFNHDNTGAQGEWMVTLDLPAHNRVDINISSLRLRGVRLPPQSYEANRHKLFHRLIREGAEVYAATVVRDVIFAKGVSFDALMAPIRKREMSLLYGGAKRMWQVLLETKEGMPGQKKYFCLLCPVGNRPGWKDNRDATRHFNREHFGFSFPCEYW
jgi:hypothetical protein